MSNATAVSAPVCSKRGKGLHIALLCLEMTGLTLEIIEFLPSRPCLVLPETLIEGLHGLKRFAKKWVVKSIPARIG
jgi:hypothetical protein